MHVPCVTVNGGVNLFARLRGRLGLRGRLAEGRERGYHWATPHARKLATHLSGTTVALLEFKHEPKARWGWGSPPHPWFYERFASGIGHYRDVVADIAAVMPELRSVPRSPSPGEPSWDNDYFPALDAALLYATLVRRQAKTFLEVGSGHSTLFARRAISNNHLPTRIVSIDPVPRADVDAVCDEMHRVGLADADLTLFEKLDPGDVVLIDGSHTSFMNSDTVVTWFDVVPRIPHGVLLGIHDIFLPWDYPPEWADRWYAEQYVAGAFLLGQPEGWRVHFPAWFVAKETDLCQPLDELWTVSGWPADWGGSTLWLERLDLSEH